MSPINRGFRAHPLQYIWQCLLAALAVVIALLVMDAVKHTVHIAALGATAFIVFTMPDLKISQAQRVLGGYAVGVAIGALSWLLFSVLFDHLDIARFGASRHLGLLVFSGLAVGLSIFLMVITNTEHPPASGVALGLVVNPTWDLKVLVVILAAVVVLCLVKLLLNPFMRNLL